jgi:hypothetical protein
MIRLSQRAWNNVIIVSMLILIVLFNFSSSFLNDGSNKAPSLLSLVPVNMAITTMEFEQEKIERIGQGWRTSSGTYSNQRIVNLVKHWGGAKISLLEQSSDWQAPSLTAKIWFAGHTLPTEYQFVQLAGETLVKIDNKIYQLISPNYKMLILSE